MRVSRFWFLAAALLAAPAPAQTPRPEPDPDVITLELIVLDRDGTPVRGLGAHDFVVEGSGHPYPVAGTRELAAENGHRRFVFVFNRRGAEAAQLNRALRAVRSFIGERMFESDESLFADLGETLRIGRAFGPGKGLALAGLDTIPAMGYRSPAGAEDDAVATARMLGIVADRLAAAPGRKIVALFSGSLSSFSRGTEQPGVFRTSNITGIRAAARGEPDAGLASITDRLAAATATVHVLHLAGVAEYENRILAAERQEFDPMRPFSSTSFDGRLRAVSPRGADDILSSVATETDGLYFSRATGFRSALDRIEARNRTWYRLNLIGEMGAGERESEVLRVRVSGCGDCTVLPAPKPARD